MNTTNLFKQLLPSLQGDWGLQSSHQRGCGHTKGSESPFATVGKAGGRLLMGLLFALFTLTASAQANYNLHICGTQVTSENCNDLSVIDGVSGIVNFNPETNTLTLDNATINFSTEPLEYKQPISGNMENLTILLKGSNYVKYALDGNSNIVIQNFGNLTITSSEGGELTLEKETNRDSYIYISSGYTLTIKDCSVIMNGSRANTWIWGVSAAGSTLTLDGASLKITDVCYPIKASAVNLQGGTYLAEPSAAVFDSSDKCYKVDGNEVQWNMKFKLMEPYVVYTPDNTTLTFYYDGLSSSRGGTIYGLNENGDPAWRLDGTNASVTNVVFDPSFADARPTSTVSWFCDMYNLENISGLKYLNTSEVTNMMQMFASRSKLTSLDLSGWNVENLGSTLAMFAFGSSLKTIDLRGWKTTSLFNTSQMFYGCTSLATIYVSDEWTNANIGNSDNMFAECTSLKGYQGTTYDADHVDAAYARLDGGTSAPGYFSEMTAAPYAVLSTDGSTLTFYYDKLSSSREGTVCPIPWTDTVPDWYYYSFNTVNFDESFDAYHDLINAKNMFYRSEELTTINNIQYLHTDYVTDMEQMFSECEKLTTLDVSYLNTSNVTTMRNMFSDCEKLEEIYGLEYFNTSNVTDMRYMFSGDWALTTIDVSHFTVQENCNLEGMFYNNTNLTTIYCNSSWSDDWHSSDKMFKYCYKLVGGKGTKYDGDITNKAYARPDGGPDSSTPGYFTEKPEAYVGIGGTTLTFYYDISRRAHAEATYDLTDESGQPGWKGHDSEVTVVQFDSSFANARPNSTAGWFYDMGKLEYINNLQYLNTSKVTDMSAMFSGCSSLTELDLSYFDTNKVRYMYAMFVNCTNLTTIYVGDKWSTAAVADHGSIDMFAGCNNLVGGNGTPYDVNHRDAEYARIDGLNGQPGYLTAIPYLVINGTTLTFYDDGEYNKEGIIYTLNGWDRRTEEAGTNVTTVVFDPSFAHTRPTSTVGWFYSLTNLTTITGMENLNTSEVTEMSAMFAGCSSLTTLDLSHFNTSKVTDMAWMFVNCTNLTTIYVGSGWSTKNVTESPSMFENCVKLKGGKGTTYDEAHMDKEYARPDGGPDSSTPGYFTAKPEAYVGIGGTTLTFYYDISRRAHAEATYDLTDESGQPGWKGHDSEVTVVQFDSSFANARPNSTAGWFYDMGKLEYINNLQYLNTSKVTDMSAMFSGCSSLTELDLSNFDISEVRYMYAMFANCTNLTTIYVSDKWSTAAVADHGSIDMFGGCEKLVGGNGTPYDVNHRDAEYARIDGLNGQPGYLTAMPYLVLNGTTLTFYDDGEYNKEGTVFTLSSWNSRTEEECTSVTKVVFDPSFAHARPTSTSFWFTSLTNLTTLTGMENLNTSEVTEMFMMFGNCSSLTELDLSHFNTSKVTNMGLMFVECGNLTTIYVGSGWSTKNATESSAMFANCFNLVGGKSTTYDEAHMDKEYAHVDGGSSYPGYFTSKGEPEAYAVLSSDGTTLSFYHDNQRGAHPGEAYDLNTGENEPGWYTGDNCLYVTTVVFDPSFADARPVSTTGWFYNMENLTDITDMKYLNTSEVINMMYMFAGCSNLTSLDVSNFNTAKVTNMGGMFGGCSSLTELDLSSFNTANVTGMDAMFVFSNNLKTIYVSNKWSTENVTLDPSNALGMFGVCLSLVGGNGTKYDENHVDKEYARIDDPANGKPGYFTYKASILLGDVNDDGKVNVADITALTNHLLGIGGSFNEQAADVDGVNGITIDDVRALVNLVLRQ